MTRDKPKYCSRFQFYLAMSVDDKMILQLVRGELRIQHAVKSYDAMREIAAAEETKTRHLRIRKNAMDGHRGETV